MNPYPIEFRQKIIDTYITEKPSIRQLALRFNTAKSFIQKLLKQYKETNDISPKRQGGIPPRKLSDEHMIVLIEIIEKNNDATLQELCNLLENTTGIKVCCTTMWKITQKLNYTFKKNTICSRKRTGGYSK